MSQPDYSFIAEEIRKDLRRRGISMQEAAKRMGITDKALYLRLSGRPLSAKTAHDLHAILEINEEFLHSGTGPVSPYIIQNTATTLLRRYLGSDQSDSEEPEKEEVSSGIVERLVAALEESTKAVKHLTEENRQLRARLDFFDDLFSATNVRQGQMFDMLVDVIETYTGKRRVAEPPREDSSRPTADPVK